MVNKKLIKFFYFQPSFSVTNLRRGQSASSHGSADPDHRTSMRQDNNHRLCVRFSKKENGSNSTKANSSNSENAIEVILKPTGI